MSTTKTKTASLKETMKKTEFTLGVIVIALFVMICPLSSRQVKYLK